MCGTGEFNASKMNDVPRSLGQGKMQDRNKVSECVTGQFSINNWKHKYGTPELEWA